MFSVSYSSVSTPISCVHIHFMCPHPFFSAHTHQTQRAQTTPPSSSNTRARGEGPSARGGVDETPRARGTV
ncbi:protein CHUP1, chloroplastic [Iris pallida]|uniref:Protein CHUP1, chloroplastic n=1 Tax=Iris pallida TaxID=29817 RepID=A0AAX6HQZ6_IRIPA|nr:protein CHUP1, chloroplastic [Iris pallida]